MGRPSPVFRRLRRFVAGSVAAGALVLTGAGSMAEGAIRHVIHISVDGLRGDFLRALVEQPGSQYTGFQRLVREGAVTYNARCDYSHSITTPNHTSMITGRPVIAEAPLPPEIQHGYLTNYTIETDLLQEQGSPPGYKASTFDRVHDLGMRTALLLSKAKMGIFARSYGPEHGAPDAVGEDNGRNKFDLVRIHEGQTAPLIAALLAEMSGDFPAYTFLHLCDPDYAGHSYGWTSQQWRDAVKGADTQLNLIMAALDERPELRGQTAIVLTADHGGGVPDTSHVDPAHLVNCTIPVILWGGSVPGGVDAHSLFENRVDPGVYLVNNTDPRQPLRNGDTGNIAMALLGLAPVEGSFHRPVFQPRLDVRRFLPGRRPDTVTVRWPSYVRGMELRSSPVLDAETWIPLETPAEEEDGFFSHTLTVPPGGRMFFRLYPAPP